MKFKQHYRAVVSAIESVTSNYSLDKTNSGHFKVTLRHGDHSRVVFHSGTPSDHRALKNFLAELRREYRALKELSYY